jgi:hypothetical protein
LWVFVDRLEVVFDNQLFDKGCLALRDLRAPHASECRASSGSRGCVLKSSSVRAVESAWSRGDLSSFQALGVCLPRRGARSSAQELDCSRGRNRPFPSRYRVGLSQARQHMQVCAGGLHSAWDKETIWRGDGAERLKSEENSWPRDAPGLANGDAQIRFFSKRGGFGCRFSVDVRRAG